MLATPLEELAGQEWKDKAVIFLKSWSSVVIISGALKKVQVPRLPSPKVLIQCLHGGAQESVFKVQQVSQDEEPLDLK